MSYLRVEEEYLHSSGIVEFVWLLFAFLALIVSVLRVFKIKCLVHGDEDLKEISEE